MRLSAWIRRSSFMLVVSLGLVMVASTAYATTDPPPSGCNSGDVCLFQDANYGGTKLTWDNPTVSHGCYTLSGGALNNAVSSIKNLNNGSHHINLFDGTSCTGSAVSFGPGDTANMAFSGMNDLASSFKLI